MNSRIWSYSLLVIFTLLSGCVIKTIKSEKLIDLSGNTVDISDELSGRDIILTIDWTNQESGIISNQANVSKMLLMLKEMRDYLKSNSCVRDIYIEPTKGERIQLAATGKNPIELNIKISEVINDTGFAGVFLVRMASFGFYPQEVTKEINSEIRFNSEKNNSTNSCVTKLVENYRVPMLIIPIDLESHPFSLADQIPDYFKIIKSQLKKAAPICFKD